MARFDFSAIDSSGGLHPLRIQRTTGDGGALVTTVAASLDEHKYPAAFEGPAGATQLVAKVMGGADNTTVISTTTVSAIADAPEKATAVVVHGEPADGKVPAWNATAGRFEWADAGGSAASVPVGLVGVAGSSPGAAAMSTIGTDLATIEPAVSLFDAPGLFEGYGCLADAAGTIIAGCVGVNATFIGHALHLIYRSTDSGQTWTGVATPLDAGIGGSAFVSCVIAVGGGVWYATGFDGTTGAILHSTDDGVTWTAVSTVLPTSDSEVSFIAYDGTMFYIIGAGDTGDGLYSTTNFASWTSIPGPKAQFVTALAKVVATPTALMVWAQQAGTPLMLAVSHDHGATFTYPAGDTNGYIFYIYDLRTDGAGHWLAWCSERGSPSSASSCFIQSLDDGVTWSVDTLVENPAFATTVASAFRAGDGWVSVWGPSISGGAGGYVVYKAPVAEPLVWTPTGYAASNVQSPTALVSV